MNCQYVSQLGLACPNKAEWEYHFRFAQDQAALLAAQLFGLPVPPETKGHVCLCFAHTQVIEQPYPGNLVESPVKPHVARTEEELKARFRAIMDGAQAAQRSLNMEEALELAALSKEMSAESRNELRGFIYDEIGRKLGILSTGN